MQYLKAELLTFMYFEKERLSLFLFDNIEPNKFLVVSEMLTDAPGGQADTTFIEMKFRAAFAKLLDDFNNKRFQALPDTSSTQETHVTLTPEQEEAERRVSQSRMLFRELSALQDRMFYFGGSIGMARAAANDLSSSTVQFGAHAGAHLETRFDLETGIDFFSYSIIRGDLRYNIPIKQKFIHASTGISVGRVLSRVTRGTGGVSPNFPPGQLVFGPTVSFNIPLLGTSIRGELKFYLGGGSVLMGSYGFSYSL
jgi:hypothetical protein